MAISGYPRGHNVKWVTRCECTQGQISLTDTSLEPSISRIRPTTSRGNSSNGSSSSPEMLKLLVAATVWGRNSLLSSTWLR